MCVCVTHSDEIILGCDGAEDVLSLGVVQSTYVPADLHHPPDFLILQALYELFGEFL